MISQGFKMLLDMNKYIKGGNSSETATYNYSFCMLKGCVCNCSFWSEQCHSTEGIGTFTAQQTKTSSISPREKLTACFWSSAGKILLFFNSDHINIKALILEVHHKFMFAYHSKIKFCKLTLLMYRLLFFSGSFHPEMKIL